VTDLKFVKRMVGSFIISFGALLVIILMVRSLQIEAPGNLLLYLGGGWVLLAIVMYPLAKRLVRV
jgi:hypothetical protein